MLMMVIMIIMINCHYKNDHWNNLDITATAAHEQDARRCEGWFECRWDNLLRERGKAARRLSLRETWKCKAGLPIMTGLSEGNTTSLEIPFLWRFINSLYLFWFVPGEKCFIAPRSCTVITLTYRFPLNSVNINATGCVSLSQAVF